MQKKNFLSLNKNTFIFTILSLFGFGGILVISISTNTGSSVAQTKLNQKEIKIIDKTEVLNVISSRAEATRFIFTIRNKSDKVINSLYVTTGTNTYHFELIYSDIQSGIAPSAEYSFVTDFDKDLESSGLIIQAVLFEDKTDSGEISFVNEMKDKRYGEKIQLIKGKEFLDNTLLPSELDSAAKISLLKQKISSLPTDKEKNEAIKHGMHLGKERLLRYIEEISSRISSSSLTNFNTESITLKNKLEKYISKL